MLIAQITDMHVTEIDAPAYGRVDTADALVRCIERLEALTPRPDLVIATGDLVNDGRPAQYLRLREVLAPLILPLYVLPGNHDDREALREAFADHAYLPSSGKLYYTVDGGPVRIIALDTLEAGAAHGVLDGAQLDWLDRTLTQAPAAPTLIAMHHPPFATGTGFMDAIGLHGAAAFARIVAAHPQIERIICGHIHRPVTSRVGGAVATISPGTAHQVALALEERAPDAIILAEPPAFQLHRKTDDQPMVTHTVYIDEPAVIWRQSDDTGARDG